MNNWFIIFLHSATFNDKIAFFIDCSCYEIHSWCANKTTNKYISRVIINFFWTANLLNMTIFQ